MTIAELSEMYAELVFSSARERNNLMERNNTLVELHNDLLEQADEDEELIDTLKDQLRGKQALLSLTLDELKSERAEKNQMHQHLKESQLLSDQLRQAEDTIEHQRNTIVAISSHPDAQVIRTLNSQVDDLTEALSRANETIIELRKQNKVLHGQLDEAHGF